MLKGIGIILVTLSLCGAGFAYTTMMQRQLLAAEEALRGVRLLKGQIEFLHLPLREAIASLRDQNLIFEHLYQNGCPLEKERLNEVLKESRLGRFDRACIMELFQEIPILPAGETSPFENTERQLMENIELQKAALQQTGTLYPKLGLLAGLTVLLILI